MKLTELGGCVFKVSVTKKLILSIKDLHPKYQVDFEAKIKLVEQEVACKWQLEADGQERETHSAKGLKSMQRFIWRKKV